jgi:RimJ/RimL family protein N-acetyltransferase
MTFSELLTPRLALRRLRLSDCAAVFAVRSDPHVSRFQLWEPRSVEEVRSFLEGLLDLEPDTPGTWFQLAITLQDSGLLIGDCGLHFPPGEPHQAEVGITLASDHQGQGYATEALSAVLDYLFLSLGKHRVFASVDPRNRASIALLERVGMRKEAHLRESVWCQGEWADDLVFAVLEREWRARRLVGDK